MITGAPGSGKSTLAVAMGTLTGLPVFHMDIIHYKSGWIERTQSDKHKLTHNVHILDEWIFEGGHSRTYAERIQRADTFIWLDFPVLLRLYRVLWRAIKYRGKTRPDLPDGCPEQFNLQTLEFIGFILRTRKSARIKLQNIFKNPPSHLKVIRLSSIKEIEDYLHSLE